MNTDKVLEKLRDAAQDQQRCAPGCPPDEMFRAYRESRLEPEEVDGLERHMEECDRCLDYLATDIRQIPTLRDGVRRSVMAATAPSQAMRSMFRFPQLALGTGLAVALLLVAVWPRNADLQALPPYSMSLGGQLAEARGEVSEAGSLARFGPESEVVFRAAPLAGRPTDAPRIGVFVGPEQGPLTRLDVPMKVEQDALSGGLELRIPARTLFGEVAGVHRISLLLVPAGATLPVGLSVETGEPPGALRLDQKCIYGVP